MGHKVEDIKINQLKINRELYDEINYLKEKINVCINGQDASYIETLINLKLNGVIVQFKKELLLKIDETMSEYSKNLTGIYKKHISDFYEDVLLKQLDEIILKYSSDNNILREKIANVEVISSQSMLLNKVMCSKLYLKEILSDEDILDFKLLLNNLNYSEIKKIDSTPDLFKTRIIRENLKNE